MVFDFVEGKTLSDEEITVDHCKKIGKVLAKLHSLDYSSLELDRTIIKYTKLYDWESYLNNTNFEKMTYKELFTANYKKYNDLLKNANEKFNNSNKIFVIEIWILKM